MSKNWGALVINDYETVFPLTWKRKLGINYLPQPYFTSQLGAFGVIDDEREKLFHQYILKHFKLIEYELNSANHIQSKYIQPKHTFVIEYKNGFSFNQNTKRNITKAKENRLRIEEVPQNEIISLSEKILNPFLLQELHLPKLEVKRFSDLLKNCIAEKSLLTLKTVNQNNEIKAIAHFVFNSRYALFLKGTNTDKADNSGSMHLLMEHAINFFSDKVECFDFGGGSVNEGLANFYKGFGGTQHNFSFLRVNNLPKVFKLFKK
ncbi:MAG: hypothetical protein KF900_07965 [Bacteroidetes bacterium]|nr:hypothetical protein [Bacteroidota bacterium]